MPASGFPLLDSSRSRMQSIDHSFAPWWRGGWLLMLMLILAGWPALLQAAEPAAKGPITQLKLVASPLVPRSADGPRNVLTAQVESSGLPAARLRLTAPGWAAPVELAVTNLAKGRQAIDVTVPALSGPLAVSVEVEAPAGTSRHGPFEVAPPRHWTVYLNQHTHTDIGYTRPQTEILPEHLRYIDYALDYCDLTDGYPDDARFRWTCETAWAVREYLAGRPAAQIERLKRRVSEGRIETCGLLLNMSEIATENSLGALLRAVPALNALGVPVRTAMQNDVNGAGWCLVDYFNGVGIRYLTMGINQTRSILPFDKPTCFWWESPSGRRILASRPDHYHQGNFWKIHEGRVDRFQPGLSAYLVSLAQRSYPFDRVGVQFSGYHTDNSPPSTIACDLVREWNERYEWPRLRLSTAQEFLAYVEREHGGELPVHRQAWPDWWTDGFGSAARETAAARETETAMQVNHGLLAMASILGATIQPDTMRRAAAIQDDLLFYHEHTYGAAESISDPLAENAQVQWGEKASYVWTAVKDANLLREEAFGLLQDFLPRAEVPTLAVFNTLNWARSGLVRVFIDHQLLPADRACRLFDGAEPVLAQEMERRAEGTYWALWVKDVPPMGFKILRLEASSDPRPAAPAQAEGTGMENSFYRLTADATRGAIKSLIDKETGAELVDAAAAWGLGQCLRETMPANREIKPGVFERTPLRNVKVHTGAAGPVWRSLVVEGDLDGCATNRGVRAEFRLYEAEKRIELHYAVRKLPVASPESIYVALPFHAPESRMLYEAQGGLVTPGDDQLPGSASDWQTWQSFLAIRGPQSQIVLGSVEAPLVQLGDFNLGKWMPVTKVERPHVYSWVMNNYWFTNFRDEQQGEFRWQYYLASGRETTRAAATRFGWNSRVPLVTRVLPAVRSGARAEPRMLSTLSLVAPNLVVVEARPTRAGDGIFVHLREVEGQPVILGASEVSSCVPMQSATEVNVLETRQTAEIESLAVKPYDVRFVELRFR